MLRTSALALLFLVLLALPDPTAAQRPGACGPGYCIGGSFCDNCVCYVPEANISRLACQCGRLNPACGMGTCVGSSYCTGPHCLGAVCFAPNFDISKAMCGGWTVTPWCAIVP